MTEAFSEERLWQLAERWRREPTSRIFVQLAEEYRRGGRHREALGVLEQGLVHHPDYVSALVVLGRCRLDAGDAPGAAVAFERALAQDPAQLVANKLLVEAYLRSAQPAKARERLAFYRLVNDRDTEIEDLERRIAAASRARVPVPPMAPGPPPPSALVAPEPPEPPARELPEPPPPRQAASAPIFDLGPAPVRAAPALELAAPSHVAPARLPTPFGELHDPAAAARRIARALAAGGLFPLAVTAEPAAAPFEPTSRAVTAAAVAVEIAPPAPAPELRAEAPVAVEPEPAPWWRGMPESFEAAPPPAELSPAAAGAPPAGFPAELTPLAPEETPPAPAAAEEVAAAPVPAAPAAEAPPWGSGARAAPELDLEARAEVVAAPFSPRSIGEEVERETIEEPFDEVLEASSTTAALPRRPPAPPPAALAAFEAAPETAPERPGLVAPPPPPAPEPAAPAPPPAGPAAVGPSATLGELYLQQGFVDEAEREFRAVLELRAGDAVAVAGLEEIRRRRAGERPEAPPPRALPAGLTRRKIETLRDYLERFQRARGGGHVS